MSESSSDACFVSWDCVLSCLLTGLMIFCWKLDMIYEVIRLLMEWWESTERYSNECLQNNTTEREREILASLRSTMLDKEKPALKIYFKKCWSKVKTFNDAIIYEIEKHLIHSWGHKTHRIIITAEKNQEKVKFIFKKKCNRAVLQNKTELQSKVLE